MFSNTISQKFSGVNFLLNNLTRVDMEQTVIIHFSRYFLSWYVIQLSLFLKKTHTELECAFHRSFIRFGFKIISLKQMLITSKFTLSLGYCLRMWPSELMFQIYKVYLYDKWDVCNISYCIIHIRMYVVCTRLNSKNNVLFLIWACYMWNKTPPRAILHVHSSYW